MRYLQSLLKVGVWGEGDAWVPSRLEDPKEFRAGDSCGGPGPSPQSRPVAFLLLLSGLPNPCLGSQGDSDLADRTACVLWASGRCGLSSRAALSNRNRMRDMYLILNLLAATLIKPKEKGEINDNMYHFKIAASGTGPRVAAVSDSTALGCL